MHIKIVVSSSSSCGQAAVGLSSERKFKKFKKLKLWKLRIHSSVFPKFISDHISLFPSLPCYQILLFQSWEQAASPWEEGGREFPAPPGTFHKHLCDLQDSAQPEISESPRSQEFPLWKFLCSRQDLGVFHCWDLLMALLTSVVGNSEFPKGILGCKTSS